MASRTHSAHGRQSLNRLAVSATVHCLTGCAIGEVLGMVLATWWGWANGPSIALGRGARVLLRLPADQPAAAPRRDPLRAAVRSRSRPTRSRS